MLGENGVKFGADDFGKTSGGSRVGKINEFTIYKERWSAGDIVEFDAYVVVKVNFFGNGGAGHITFEFAGVTIWSYLVK